MTVFRSRTLQYSPAVWYSPAVLKVSPPLSRCMSLRAICFIKKVKILSQRREVTFNDIITLVQCYVRRFDVPLNEWYEHVVYSLLQTTMAIYVTMEYWCSFKRVVCAVCRTWALEMEK